jgi:hypothetical protein
VLLIGADNEINFDVLETWFIKFTFNIYKHSSTIATMVVTISNMVVTIGQGVYLHSQMCFPPDT